MICILWKGRIHFVRPIIAHCMRIILKLGIQSSLTLIKRNSRMSLCDLAEFVYTSSVLITSKTEARHRSY